MLSYMCSGARARKRELGASSRTTDKGSFSSNIGSLSTSKVSVSRNRLDSRKRRIAIYDKPTFLVKNNTTSEENPTIHIESSRKSLRLYS